MLREMLSPKKLSLLAGALLFLEACLWLVRLEHMPYPWENSNAQRQAAEPAEQGTWLDSREKEADQKFWPKEILAQICGQTFESFWDSVNASTNKLSLVAEFASKEVALGEWGAPETLPHGIKQHKAIGSGPTLS